MTKLRTIALILYVAVLLLVCAVSAGDMGSSADGSATLRASTAAGGTPFAPVEGASDASPGAAQSPWMGLIVLIFGGLLGGLWFFAGILLVVRGLSDVRPRAEHEKLPQHSSRTRDEALSVDRL